MSSIKNPPISGIDKVFRYWVDVTEKDDRIYMRHFFFNKYLLEIV